MKGLVVLLGLVSGIPAAHAEDRKHVALLEFEGPRAASVRGDVMRIAVAKSWVSASSTLEGRSIREFAADHDLDMVVEGVVKKRDHSYEIRIRFLRGSTGRVIATTTVSAMRPALDRASRLRITRELVRALAMLPPHHEDA